MVSIHANSQTIDSVLGFQKVKHSAGKYALASARDASDSDERSVALPLLLEIEENIVSDFLGDFPLDRAVDQRFPLSVLPVVDEFRKLLVGAHTLARSDFLSALGEESLHEGLLLFSGDAVVFYGVHGGELE